MNSGPPPLRTAERQAKSIYSLQRLSFWVFLSIWNFPTYYSSNIEVILTSNLCGNVEDEKRCDCRSCTKDPCFVEG